MKGNTGWNLAWSKGFQAFQTISKLLIIKRELDRKLLPINVSAQGVHVSLPQPNSWTETPQPVPLLTPWCKPKFIPARLPRTKKSPKPKDRDQCRQRSKAYDLGNLLWITSLQTTKYLRAPNTASPNSLRLKRSDFNQRSQEWTSKDHSDLTYDQASTVTSTNKALTRHYLKSVSHPKTVKPLEY